MKSAIIQSYLSYPFPLTQCCNQKERRIIKMSEGMIDLRDQLKEYQFQGTLFENMNLFDFVSETYDVKLHEEMSTDTETTRGRPPNG